MPELLMSPEPMIYTMPERFRMAPRKGLSMATIFFIIIGLLFILVIGGATWYFTRGLGTPAPVTPPINPTPAAETPSAIPQTNPEVPLPAASSEIPAPAPTVALSQENPATNSETTPAPTPANSTPTRGQDTDADGLTDIEEVIFNTSPTQPDTDGDGYLDGHEVLNLYNPAGLAPQRIEDAGLAVRYRNANFSYEVLYPTKWQKEETDATLREVKFKSDTGEFISLTVADNIDNLSLSEWYKRQALAGEAGVLKEVKTKNGLTGYLAPDGLTAYFAGQGVVYAISYNLNGKLEIDYPRVFEMVVASFKF